MVEFSKSLPGANAYPECRIDNTGSGSLTFTVEPAVPGLLGFVEPNKSVEIDSSQVAHTINISYKEATGGHERIGNVSVVDIQETTATVIDSSTQTSVKIDGKTANLTRPNSSKEAKGKFRVVYTQPSK